MSVSWAPCWADGEGAYVAGVEPTGEESEGLLSGAEFSRRYKREI